MPTCEGCKAVIPEDETSCHKCGLPVGASRGWTHLQGALDQTISSGPPVDMDIGLRQTESATPLESGIISKGRTVRAQREPAAPTEKLPAAIVSESDQQIERADTTRAQTTPFCPECGSDIEESNAFCPSCGANLSDEAKRKDSLIGLTIADNFLLERVLGEGAMGRVYLARQLSLDKHVAIKVLHNHLENDKNVARRFHREARAASRLNHPNSLHIIDFGQTDDQTLYIAMEFIEGSDLHEIMKEEFPLPIERIANLIGQVCLALDEAHASGIVHRDLKPENIMVVRRRDGSEEVKVCDFGIAKIQDPGDSDASAPITVAGIVCGTPEYMSPEQCRGEPLDGRADIYSLGVILYQLITNALPFVATTPLGVVTRQLTDDVVRPTMIQDKLELTEKLEPVVMRALAKEREDRYPSALLLKEELDRIANGEEISLPTAPFYKSQKTDQKKKDSPRSLIASAVILVSLAALVTGWFLTRNPQSTGALHPAAEEDADLSGQGTPDLSGDGAIASTTGDAFASTTGDAISSAIDGSTATFDVSQNPLKRTPWTRSSARGTRDGSHSSKNTKTSAEVPARESPPGKTTPPGNFQLGREAFEAGRITEAIEYFERAKQANPNNADVHLMLGKCYFRAGQTSRGRSAYRRYLELRPNAKNREIFESIIAN